ncbi:MAG: ABC transporter substrate-binding protein [Bacillota bacterium]
MRWIAAIMGLVALIVAYGCKEKGGSGQSNEIVIGEYTSMTGATATFGQSSHNALMLAIDQINASGGVLGKKIRVVAEDDRSDANEAVTAVQKLISRDHVVAVIGEVTSKRSLAAGNVCQQYKIPMLSPSATNPQVTKVGDYVFRICFTDDFQGGKAAEFAARRGWKRVAIFTDVANDYSKGLSEAFRETYPKSGGEIVKEESFREGDNEFKSQLTTLKSANPDAVFLPGYYTDIAKILRQARQLELNVPFFGGDGWDSPTTLQLGGVADGCFFLNHYSPDEPRAEVQQFVKAYRERYGETPDAMAILGYDAGRVMADAIKRAGTTEPKAMRDALAQTKNFPGASGSITMDANRNARKPVVVSEIQGTKAKLMDIIPPG